MHIIWLTIAQEWEQVDRTEMCGSVEFKYIFNKDKAIININLNNKVLENVFVNYYKNNKVLNLNNIYSNFLQLQLQN